MLTFAIIYKKRHYRSLQKRKYIRFLPDGGLVVVVLALIIHDKSLGCLDRFQVCIFFFTITRDLLQIQLFATIIKLCFLAISSCVFCIIFNYMTENV
jgi:hypothetical protein